MEEQELKQRLEAIEAKLEATFQSAEKTRKYIRNTIIVTVVATILFFVLPLIGLYFVIPSFINTYSQIGGIQ